MRIGVFGGTFNPPHIGHLICAQEAYVRLGLDRVLLMPAAVPPHKPVPEDPGSAHRLQMCRAAVEEDGDRFEASDLEVIRGGASYTVATLEKLTAQAPDSEFFLILGGDVAAGLPSWRDPERVLELATPAIAARRGTPEAAVTGALAQIAGGERARFFKMPAVAISSTMIRKRIAKERPIKYLVSEGVERYVASHGLYRARSAA